MASIDAFWELAASELACKPVLRMSLRRLGPAVASTFDKSAAKQRALILVGVALLQLLFVLALREAMRPLFPDRTAESAPLQITFIEQHRVSILPTPRVTQEPVHRQARPSQPRSWPTRSLLQPPRSASPTDDALQAVTVAPSIKPAESVPPKTSTVDSGTALHVPEATVAEHPRDLLAHRDVSFMLPGGARKDSPDFHVRSGVSPEGVVNTAGRVVSKMMANALAPRPDSDGVMPMAADRGMRTSDRDSDPCQDIAQDRISLDDAKAADEAERRYEESCEGH